MRGGHWFERMKTDHKDQILDGARRMAGASR
nr:MAG TPA: Minor capsid protein [Caudoviricetes sp.]